MRLLLAVALLALLGTALAGCSGKDPLRYPNGVSSSTSHSGSVSASASASATGTSSPGGNGTVGNATGKATNHAPVPVMVAVVNGTSASFNLTASDADNDTLTWTLAFGDGNATNGTTLPAQVAHVYAAGNFTVNFTVSDGKLARSMLANLTAGTALQSVVLAGHASVPDPYGKIPVYQNGCSLTLLSGNGEPEGTFGTTFTLDVDYGGWTWAIAPASGFTTMWWTGSTIDGAGPTGTVTPGADHVDGCAQPPGTGGDFTITLTPP